MATLETKPLQQSTQTAANPFQTASAAGTNMAFNTAPTPTYTGTQQIGNEAGIVNNYLGGILGNNNALMRNAATTGIETAAARGLGNSSIAAGNAQRAALDYAVPLTQQAMNTFNTREGRAWQSDESGLDRYHQTTEREASQGWQSGESALDRDWRTGERLGQQGWQTGEREASQGWQTGERLGQQGWQTGEREASQGWQTGERRETQGWQTGEREGQQQWTGQQNQLDRDQQITMSEIQNWLNSESFTREFNAQLASFPIQNTTQLLNMIAEQAVTNPDIYTPDIVSGLSEFFTTNFLDVLGRYFPSMYQANTGG